MKSPDGATKSSWYDAVQIPPHGPPSNSARADVCVVGAGIAGLTTAYLLCCEGKKVVVLDEGEIGSGQTGRTSAHLSSVIDDRFYHLEKTLGAEASRLAYQSHAKAIDTIQRIANDERIDCDFQRLDGLLFPADETSADELDQELQAAKRAGFEGVEKIQRPIFASQRAGLCLRFPNQARFHPLKYLVGLSGAIEKRGGAIYCGCRVKDVRGADPKKRQPARARIDDGPAVVEADAIVVATNTPAPINDWMGIYTKQASYRTYIVAGKVPGGSVDDALYWDMADPYHYVRLDGDLLIVGGEDHKTGQFPDGDAPFARLETWARRQFPVLGKIDARWSGQVQEPADGVAFIGKALTGGESVYVVTGDSGMGLTHGTIAGLLITDQIQKRTNPWQDLYDPGRKQINLEFAREAANMVAQYADLLTAGDVKSVADIPAGSGAILREGTTKLAVYRSEAGALTRCSALCTHLKCVVQWNHVEKTWDCPCHGSRFDPTGKVLMGPAIDDLPSAS
jgi:glycine/D-amino acid oxidase-like deaminating enzyme/nitrite reductase/ring-hydroxylating ferredoxin subunit